MYYMLQPYRLSLFVSVFSFRYGPALMAHSELFVTSAPPVEGRAVELDVLSFLDQFGEDNSTAERCYRSHSHSSVLQGLPFGGVPTVLAINGVLWMVQTHTQSFSLTFYKKIFVILPIMITPVEFFKLSQPENVHIWEAWDKREDGDNQLSQWVFSSHQQINQIAVNFSYS